MSYNVFYENYTDPDTEPELVKLYTSIRQAWKYAIDSEYLNYEIGIKRDKDYSHPYPDDYIRLNSIKEKRSSDQKYIIFNMPKRIRKYKLYMITMTPVESMYVIKGDPQKIINRFHKIIEKYQEEVRSTWIHVEGGIIC